MVLPVFPTLAIGVITLVVWCIYNTWQQKQRYPPGPLNLPVVANIKSILEMMSDVKIWERLRTVQEKYGDVFTVFFVNQPTVVLGSLDSIREALVTKGSDFDSRPESHFTDYFSMNYKNIIFGQPTPVWKAQRQIAHATFRKFATGEALERYIHHSLDKLGDELDKVANSGKTLDPKHCLQMTIYNIIMPMVFGKMFEHNDPIFNEFIRIMDKINDVYASGLLADFIPIFKHIPTSDLKNFHEATDALHKLIKDVYTEHEETYDESNIRDIVDQMIYCVKKIEKEEGKESMEKMTLLDYQMLIMDIFGAGTDTSRYTLFWAVLFMAAFPETQQKMREEVEGVVGEVPVGVRHREQLPYSKAFLYEVIRMRPVVPLAVTHMTSCDTSVGGFKIPKGTQVIPNLWALTMNKEAWGDPEAFRPERFLDDNGQMGPHNSNWMPFSTGSRVCVAETLAKTELQLIIASLVQKYEFRAPPGILLDLRVKTPGQMMVPEDHEILVNKRIV